MTLIFIMLLIRTCIKHQILGAPIKPRTFFVPFFYFTRLLRDDMRGMVRFHYHVNHHFFADVQRCVCFFARLITLCFFFNTNCRGLRFQRSFHAGSLAVYILDDRRLSCPAKVICSFSTFVEELTSAACVTGGKQKQGKSRPFVLGDNCLTIVTSTFPASQILCDFVIMVSFI